MIWTRDRVRQFRRYTGENARAFGAAVGRSGRSVEDWEQGRRVPDAAVARLLTLRLRSLIASRARAGAKKAARAREAARDTDGHDPARARDRAADSSPE